MQFGKWPCQWQSDAGTCIYICILFQLIERIEYFIGHFGRYYLTVVLYNQIELHIVLFKFHIDCMFGVTDRIWKQIVQNFNKRSPVDQCMDRQLRHMKFYFLIYRQCHRKKLLIYLIHNSRYIPNDKIHCHLIGIHLSEIQDLINQSKQFRYVPLHELDILLYLMIFNIHLGQRLERTVDQRQRRSYLMGYVSKEIDFGAIQFFLLFTLKHPLLFQCLLLTHIQVISGC